MDTRFLFVLMYEQALACSFLCALGDILNCHTFTGIGCVVISGVRDFNDTHELIAAINVEGTVENNIYSRKAPLG